MNFRHIGLGIIVFLLVFLLAFFMIFFFIDSNSSTESSNEDFYVGEFGSAGEMAYSVFTFSGQGNVSLLTLRSPPRKMIYLFNDSQALGASKFSELFESLKRLQEYGYSVNIANTTSKVSNGLLIVPTGGMPLNALSLIKTESSNLTFLYIGATDLVLTNTGLKRQNWYANLSPSEQKNIIIYLGTLDEFIEKQSSKVIINDILFHRWSLVQNRTTFVSGRGKNSITIPSIGENATYLRVIYDFSKLKGIFDSERLQPSSQVLRPEPTAVFPKEPSTFIFTLNRTNGTAYFIVKKDSKEIEREPLRRVTDENVFILRKEYGEPGSYIVEVVDNSGRIASGLLRVKDLKIKFLGKRGVSYLFRATLDGMPINSEATVSLSNSSLQKRFYVENGLLVVNAKLNKGLNVFKIEVFNRPVAVQVEETSEPLLEFYVKYGIPALLLVALVYVLVHLSRSPTYQLRFGDVVPYIREEVHISSSDALDVFQKAQRDLHLARSPITPHEFSIALKKYITKGADVTEGNVESLLKKLVALGYLEAYQEYFQSSDQGDTRKNALKRMIKEKLIENGIMFDQKGDKFITKDYSIGFLGDSYNGKAILVFDSENHINQSLSALNDLERIKIRLKQENGLVVLTTAQGLQDVL